MSEDVPDFNDILKQIKEQEAASTPTQRTDYPEVTDENVNDYILNRGSKLIEDSLDAVARLKDRITSATDPDELAALSQLIKATTGALGTLTSISLQNKKNKATKEIVANKISAPKTVNNTIMVGTREEAMKQFLETAKDANSDVDSVSDVPYGEESLDE